MQQSPMGGGSRSWDEMQAFRQQQQDMTFAQNLGRFAMMAGSGMAQGIGAGLAATDLRNPFAGAGAAIVGGMQPANIATSQMMGRVGQESMFQDQMARDQQMAKQRRDELLGQAEADKASFKGIAAGVGGMEMPQPTTSVEQQMQAEYNPMGFTRGASQLNAFGHAYMAQQGLQSARESMASERARRIMLGMGM